MGNRGAIVRESVRALCVLALLFLNFGHAQAAGAVGYTPELTPYLMSEQAYATFCQQIGQDNPQDHHAPCHACRIGGGADLPVPPGIGLPAFTAVALVTYGFVPQHIAATSLPYSQGARAPPRG